MNPTPADPDRRDEALGARLDQHLETLRTGTSPTTEGDDDPELETLRPVVDRLFCLAERLDGPSAEPPARPDLSTVDLPTLPGRSTVGSAVAADQPSSDDTDTGAPTPAGGWPKRVGKFEVVCQLGRGGQATTLLAFDPDLRREVVLKLYHQARTPEEREAVLQEGRALARVRSPYVAPCYSAERFEDTPYLVVEYVPGQNLADRQQARPVPLKEALELVRQAAEGLAAVHAGGLLHRDVKPANILVGEDGRARLVDFGLATPVAGGDLDRLSGTLAYMAPEQARGEGQHIGLRTDLYGLGGVLYFLLTGRAPHAGTTTAALLAAASAGDVEPPATYRPDLPAAVNDLCLRCLARDPAQRFGSAGELVTALRLARPRRRRWPLAAAFVGTAAALLLAVASLQTLQRAPKAGPEPQVARRAVQVERLAPEPQGEPTTPRRKIRPRGVLVTPEAPLPEPGVQAPDTPDREPNELLHAGPPPAKTAEKANSYKANPYKDGLKKGLYTPAYGAWPTPVSKDEQAKIAATRLKRLQQAATPGEIDSGRAANVLLDDIGKHKGKKGPAAGVVLDKDTLSRINITTRKGGSLGPLRDGGKIVWPQVLVDLLPDRERSEIGQLARAAYERAVTGKPAATQLADLGRRAQRLQDTLMDKAGDVTTSQYITAKLFLNDLQRAVRGLENGVAPLDTAWRRFVRGGKTVREVAEWLNRRGLRIAPASAGDEEAYQTLHRTLVAYDIELNAGPR
jgi:serine/threonine protein kinase/exonuclease VII small subunit